MEEFWRMRMEMLTPSSPPPPATLSNFPLRRSTGTSHHQKDLAGDSEDDFTDVFGGPPRTILSRQFSSSGMQRSSSSPSFIYQEMFSSPENEKRIGGRSLRQFSIPSENRRESTCIDPQRSNVHNNVFNRFDDDQRGLTRSRSRSRFSTLSVPSSEELNSPPSHTNGHDLSLLASKLRQINVRNRWNSKKEGFGDHRNLSPGSTTIVDTILKGSFRTSGDELDNFNSLSPQVFRKPSREIEEESLCQSEEEDDEVMSGSYFFQVNSDDNKECESNGVDEAIAWVKESFQTHYSKECQTPEQGSITCPSASSPSTGRYAGY